MQIAADDLEIVLPGECSDPNVMVRDGFALEF